MLTNKASLTICRRSIPNCSRILKELSRKIKLWNLRSSKWTRNKEILNGTRIKRSRYYRKLSQKLRETVTYWRCLRFKTSRKSRTKLQSGTKLKWAQRTKRWWGLRRCTPKESTPCRRKWANFMCSLINKHILKGKFVNRMIKTARRLRSSN